MLKNSNLKVKLILGFMVVIFIAILIGSIAFFAILNLNNALHTLSTQSIPSIINLEASLVRFERIKTALRSASNPYISLDDLKRQIDNINKARDEYKIFFGEYEKIPRTDEEDKIYQEVLKSVKISSELNNKAILMINNAISEKNDVERQKILVNVTQFVFSNEFREAMDGAINKLFELVTYVKEYYCYNIPSQAIKNANNMQIIVIATLLSGIILGFILSFSLSTSISKSLLSNVATITTNSDQLESASGQVASASQELSSGASELASSVEEITSSMEELQSIIEANTKSVNEAELLMKETVNTSKNSQKEAEELANLMLNVTDNSKKISKVNKAIDDIAFQTSILALNAAVEAARAGDAGRGFAVVADQVKSLAQKSAELSKETTDLIDSIIEMINKSSEKTNATLNSFTEAVSRAEKVSVLLDEVTRAFKEQSKGASQVTKAISQVNTVVQQTAASSEESASSSEELLSQVEQLREVIVNINSIVLGEKEALKIKNKKETKNISKKVIENKNEHKNIIEKKDYSENKIKNLLKKEVEEKDIDIVKPEDKIPLEDFKDF